MEFFASIIQSLRELLIFLGIDAKLGLSELLTFLAILIACFVIPYKFIYSHITSTEANRNHFILWLEETEITEKHKALVKWFSRRLQVVYGDADSEQAFSRSWSIAMIYPIALFFLAYSFFGGAHEFAGMEVFPEAEEGRLNVFWVTVLLVGLFSILIFASDWLDAKARKPFQYLFANQKAQDISYRLTMALLSMLVVFTYNQDWKILLAFAGLGYWLGAVAVAVAVIFDNYTFSLVFLIFLVIFPLLNALFDWLSLRVSRYYLKVVEEEDSPLWVLADICVDLVFAVLFMIALVIVLPGVTEWFNALYGMFDPYAQVDWRQYAVDAIEDPFGKGLMVTAMIITTLIPTLLHVFLGLFAFILNSLFGKQLAKYLMDVGEVSLKAVFAAIWIEAYLFFVFCLMFVLGWAFQQTFDFPIGPALYAVAEWGHNKPLVVVAILLALLGVGLYQPLVTKFRQYVSP